MTVIEQHKHDLENLEEGESLQAPRCDNCGQYFGERFDFSGDLVEDYIAIGDNDEYCVCGHCEQEIDWDANDLARERAGEPPEDDGDYWDEFHTEFLPEAEAEVKADMAKSIKRKKDRR